MDANLMEVVGKIAGIGGIALGVFLLLFRDIIQKKIFPQLTKKQAFHLLVLISILVWSVAFAGIGAWIWTKGKENILPDNQKVFLIDSINKTVVYKHGSKSNVVEVRNILKEILPMEKLISEIIASPNWNEDEYVRGSKPALIIIHASAFFEEKDLENLQPGKLLRYEKRLDRFITHVAEGTRIKFLVYSRPFCDNEKKASENFSKRLPGLEHRIVPFGVCKGDWDDPLIKNALRKEVRAILALE